MVGRLISKAAALIYHPRDHSLGLGLTVMLPVIYGNLEVM